MNGAANAIIVPHPPLIVPAIGKGEEKKIDEIVKAYQKAVERIMEQEPDIIVIISAHAPSYFDYIQISKGKKASGDLRAFNAGKERFSIEYDQELIKEIERICQEEHLPAGTLGTQDGKLDHGTMIPLHFLKGLKKQPNQSLSELELAVPIRSFTIKSGKRSKKRPKEEEEKYRSLPAEIFLIVKKEEVRMAIMNAVLDTMQKS